VLLLAGCCVLAACGDDFPEPTARRVFKAASTRDFTALAGLLSGSPLSRLLREGNDPTGLDRYCRLLCPVPDQAENHELHFYRAIYRENGQRVRLGLLVESGSGQNVAYRELYWEFERRREGWKLVLF
jgi:hypothetical protein